MAAAASGRADAVLESLDAGANVNFTPQVCKVAIRVFGHLQSCLCGAAFAVFELQSDFFSCPDLLCVFLFCSGLGRYLYSFSETIASLAPSPFFFQFSHLICERASVIA
jgi:hypothetical protein